MFSVAEFAKKLLQVLHILPSAEHEALEKACKIILEEIKTMPGEYQSGAGSFAGWADLSEKTIRDKIRGGWPTPSPLLRSGDLRDSYGYKVGKGEAWVGSNSKIAVWQELGTAKGIPPRSLVGIATARHEKEIVELVGKEMFEAMTGANLKTVVGKDGKSAGLGTTFNGPKKKGWWSR